MRETLEQYLARGARVTRCPPAAAGTGRFDRAEVDEAYKPAGRRNLEIHQALREARSRGRG